MNSKKLLNYFNSFPLVSLRAPKGRSNLFKRLLRRFAPRNDTAWKIIIFSLFILNTTPFAFSQEPIEELNVQPSADGSAAYTIFDDKTLLEGYFQKYKSLEENVIVSMIKDDTLSPFKMAACIRVFREKFSQEVVAREKRILEKIILRRLNRADSAFVQVEIFHTLCLMDRYRYFESMVPLLIQKIDHYNSTVSDMAFGALNNIVETGNNRAREARIMFETLRKILFLSKNNLANVKEPGPRLTHKLKLLRWSIKTLGTQELKKLPKEVIGLL